MSNIVWFKRCDGLELSCEEGSPAFDRMTADGSFTLLTPAAEETPIPETEEGSVSEALAEETPAAEETPKSRKKK